MAETKITKEGELMLNLHLNILFIPAVIFQFLVF